MFSDNKALRDKLNEFFNWPGAGEVFFNEKIPVRFSRPINYFFFFFKRALDETNQEDIQLLLICGHNLIYGKESVFPSVIGIQEIIQIIQIQELWLENTTHI